MGGGHYEAVVGEKNVKSANSTGMQGNKTHMHR